MFVAQENGSDSGNAVNFHLRLDAESVEHAFPSDPLAVDPKTSVREVLALLKDSQTGHVVVAESGEIQGIFTERDALKLMAEGADFQVPVADVMSPDPVTLRNQDTVGQAIQIMARGGYRRIPILDDTAKLQGVLKSSGILHYLVQHFPAVIYNLPPHPHHNTQEREGA
ncbi:MAG: hypothetical protein CMJ59_06060 [Planctomycetaceae bacterium]|nr:hypothetical protein [Planctomycetaceae bacterium]